MSNLNINYEQIEDALKQVRQICKDTEYCSSCPFRRKYDNECLIKLKSPQCWEFQSDDETGPYRMFK